MNYTIHYVEQHIDDEPNPEWLALRAGRLTASVAYKMLATIAKGEAADRRNLRLKLVLEQITGQTEEKTFMSAAMREGLRREAEARAMYEALTGDLVRNTGFISHNELMAGCSLDGCVFDASGRIVKVLELKNPEPAAHLEYLRTGKIGYRYEAQNLHALWVTGADYLEWMSYQPLFPEPIRCRLVRVERDEAAIRAYASKAEAFLLEVAAEVAEIRRMVA